MAGAMREEMNSIQRNDTWSLVEKPEGKKIVGLKWIFKTKCKADGEIQKLKARTAASGSYHDCEVSVCLSNIEELVFVPFRHQVGILTWRNS